MPQVANSLDDPHERLRRAEARIEALERRLNRAVSLRDGAGNVIAGPAAEFGLARPYLPVTWMPVQVVSDFATTPLATPMAIWQATVIKQHPNVQVTVRCDCDGTGGAAYLTMNGVPSGSELAFSDGSVQQGQWGPLPLPGDHMTPVLLQLWAYRTGGAGTVTVWPGNTWTTE